MSNSIALRGTIEYKGPVEKVTDTFSKRSFLLKEINADKPEYASIWQIELQQAKTTLLDSHNVGDTVMVDIEVTGRYWKDNKAFNTLRAWKITRLAQSSNEPVNEPINSGNEDPDIPF